MQTLIGMTFITGLISSVHCVGMCGGFIGALSLTEEGQQCGAPCQLLFNFGRVTTYTLLGFIVGGLGSALAIKNSLYAFTHPLLLGSDIFIILIGMGSVGLFRKLNFGLLKNTKLKAKMTQSANRLRQLPTPLAAVSLGLLFGFMPCGILYAMLLTAAQSADSLTGGLMMAAFGLGTSPTMLLVGHTTSWFTRNHKGILAGVGVMVALIGTYNLLSHLNLLS